MACVPPRAGPDASREPFIVHGAQSALLLQKHWKMRQAMQKSFLWHGSCKSRLWKSHVRGTASQPVMAHDMEATKRNTTRWHRWHAHETMVLIAAKKQQELEQLERVEAENGWKRFKQNWEEIEAICQKNGIQRTARQCKDRWDRLTVTYSQIRTWEKTRPPNKLSFWSMKLAERQALGFLLNLDKETYDALDELGNSTTMSVTSDALVENDVEDKAELGGMDCSLHDHNEKQHTIDEAELSSRFGQEHMDEVAGDTTGMNALLMCDNVQPNEGQLNDEALSRDNERGGKMQAESIVAFGPYHQEKSEVDVSAPTNLVEKIDGRKGLKAVIMTTYLNNADSIHQNRELRSIQQRFPADPVLDHTEEVAVSVGGTNTIFEHSTQHDCNEPINGGETEWEHSTDTAEGLRKVVQGGLENPVKSVERSEERQNKKTITTLLHAIPEKVNDGYKEQLLHASPWMVDDDYKDQLLHAGPGMVDDSYKDQHQHLYADSLIPHKQKAAVKEGFNVTISHDNNDNSSTGLKQKETMHSAGNEKGEEQSECADGSSVAYDETDFTVITDGLEVGAKNNNGYFINTLEGRETCQGQMTVSQLIPCTQVDSLHQCQYELINDTAGSFISIHEQGCEHPSEGLGKGLDTYTDKNEKSEMLCEGSKDGSLLCHKKVATGGIDSLIASVDNKQNSMKAQEANDENPYKRSESMAAQVKDFISSIEKAPGSPQKDLHRSPQQQNVTAGSFVKYEEEIGTKAVFEHGINVNKKALNTSGVSSVGTSSNEVERFGTAPALSFTKDLNNSTSFTEKADGSYQDLKYRNNQFQSFQAGDYMEEDAGMTESATAAPEHRGGFYEGIRKAEEPHSDHGNKSRTTVLEHDSSEHLEGVMKGEVSYVNKELCGDSLLVHIGEPSGITAGPKVAVKHDGENPTARIVESVSMTMHLNNSIPCSDKKTEHTTAAREHVSGHIYEGIRKDEESHNDKVDCDKRTAVLEHNIEHLEGLMKGEESYANKELCGDSLLVLEGKTNGTTDGLKVGIKDGVENPTAMIKGISRTMHANDSVPWSEKIDQGHQEVELRSIQHQFKHAGSLSDCKKGEETCVDKNGGPEKLHEELHEEGSHDSKLEAVPEDARGTLVTSRIGSKESQSKKTTSNNSAFDDDIFMYIKAAIGNLVKSVSQAIGKIFRL